MEVISTVISLNFFLLASYIYYKKVVQNPYDPILNPRPHSSINVSSIQQGNNTPLGGSEEEINHDMFYEISGGLEGGGII